MASIHASSGKINNKGEFDPIDKKKLRVGQIKNKDENKKKDINVNENYIGGENDMII